MNNDQKQDVLSYAALCFKKQSLEQVGVDIPATILDEMNRIRERLGMPHEKIIELAAQNLISED